MAISLAVFMCGIFFVTLAVMSTLASIIDYIVRDNDDDR